MSNSFETPETIVVLHGGALGDLVLLVPTLRRLRARFPQSRISLLGSPYGGSVLSGLPDLDELVLTYRKTDTLPIYILNLLKLRARRFDLLIDLHGTSRSRQQTMLLRPRRSIGMARKDASDRLYGTLCERNHATHMVAEYTFLLALLGADASLRGLDLHLPITAKHREKADSLLAECEIQGPFAVIQATTSGRPAHEVWPPERFAQVCNHLAMLGIASVATSDSKGFEIIEAIQKSSTCAIAGLVGKTTPLVLAALLERASLYFGYNTGPMHVASAVGTPTVALFERPSKFRPWHPLTRSGWRVLLPLGPSDGVFRSEAISAEDAIQAVELVRSGHAGPDPRAEFRQS